jgi:organic radical activating enzyme
MADPNDGWEDRRERLKRKETEKEAEEPTITLEKVHDRAKRTASGVSLLSLDGGESVQQKIDTVLEAYHHNPYVVQAMETYAEKYKIAALTKKYIDDELMKLLRKESLTTPESFLRFKLVKFSESAKGLIKSVVTDYNKMIVKGSDEWRTPFTPSTLTFPDIEKDCLGERRSSLSGDLLIQDKCVKLSDGRCYNFDDIITYYKSVPFKEHIVSPFTRGPFSKEDKDIIMTLITQTGGKKTKKKRKKRKKTKRN